HLQTLLMLLDQPPQLASRSQGAQHRFGPQLDQQGLVSAAGAGFGYPAGQLLAAGVEYMVGLLAAPGAGRLVLDQQPAGIGHAAQFAVDLLVSCSPEVADRVIEPVGQLIAGGGFLQQRGQQRMLNGHGVILGAELPGKQASGWGSKPAAGQAGRNGLRSAWTAQ